MAPEHDIQAAFITWVQYITPRLPEVRLSFAVPNGGLRNVITAKRLKEEGVKPGVWDWWLPVPRFGHTGLTIEFKSPGNRLTVEQEKFGEWLRAEGWVTEVCFSWVDARGKVLDYLGAMDRMIHG